MAGDIAITECAVILDTLDTGGPRAAAPTIPTIPETRFVHRYGARVLIGQATAAIPPVVAGAAKVATTEADLPDVSLANLSEVERLGLTALRLRLSPNYIAAKANRPRDGQVWDMPSDMVRAPLPGLAAPSAGAAPTSAYLEGSVAVGIVIVEGPNADLKFSQAERTKVVAEVQNALGWYSAMNPAAEISFTYDIQIVTLNVQPDPNATTDEAREALWRDPAMADLGYKASRDGVTS